MTENLIIFGAFLVMSFAAAIVSAWMSCITWLPSGIARDGRKLKYAQAQSPSSLKARALIPIVAATLVACVVYYSGHVGVPAISGCTLGALPVFAFCVRLRGQFVKSFKSEAGAELERLNEQARHQRQSDLFFNAGSLAKDSKVESNLKDLSEAIPFLLVNLPQGVKKRAFLHTVGVLSSVLEEYEGVPFEEWPEETRKQFRVNLETADHALGNILKAIEKDEAMLKALHAQQLQYGT